MVAVSTPTCPAVFAFCEGPGAGLSLGRLRMEPRAFLQLWGGLAQLADLEVEVI